MTTENHLISRVCTYPIVGYVAGTVKGYYNYAKECNSYVKVCLVVCKLLSITKSVQASLEVAEQYSQPILHKVEEYSHQPTIDSLLHKVDEYGCKQLDKVQY
jgi:hypothetical protein